MRVLYVEDDPQDFQLTLRDLSRAEGEYLLERAGTIQEARVLLEQDPAAFDLVLVDLNLPDGTGINLLTHIREQNWPLAVVVITGQGDEETAVTVLKAGAQDYLVKHTEYQAQLPGTLDSALQRFRSEQDRRSQPLRVLYGEDSPTDLELTRKHLAHYAPHIQLTSAKSGRDMLTLLPERGHQANFDLVLLDYNLAGESALDILKEIFQVRKLDVPVVVVTGHGNEDIATQTLKLGAADYLVKNTGYLFKLPSLIEQVCTRAQLTREQAALRESENRFRRLADNAPDIIFRIALHPVPHYEYISPAVLAVTGYTPEDFYSEPDLVQRIILPENRHLLNRAAVKPDPRDKPIMVRWRGKDGRVIWIEERSVTVCDENGAAVGIEGISRDVTQQKEAQLVLQRQFTRLDALRTIDLAISNSFDLRLVLIIFIEHVMRELDVDAAAILLYNPVNQTLEYGSGAGFRTSWLQRMVLRVGESYTGNAILGQRTLTMTTNLTNISQHKDWPQFIAEESFVNGVSSPLISKSEVKGVLQIFSRTPKERDEDWKNFFELLAGQISLAIYNADLYEQLQRSNQELSLAYDATLEGWVHALDLRDREMEGHTQRVSELTVELAQTMHLTADEIPHLRRGALLHDIGKMAIPDSILLKAGPLSEAEWEVMRQHPKYAMDLLAHISYLEKALDIPYCHHEKWDGSGYPRGLRGLQIPFAARMFAVIDVWDSLITPRVYRPAWPEDRAIKYIREQAGSQFDPEIAQAFIKMMGY